MPKITLLLFILYNKVESQFGNFGSSATRPRPEDPGQVRDDLPKNRRFPYGLSGRTNPKHVKPKNVVGSCDEELDMHVTDTKGILATPGFELGTYFNETDCFWIINTLPELRIEINFLYMDVEPGPPTCPFDYIEILDGESTELVSGGRFCGRDTPGAIISKTNSLKIKFHSDSADVGAGAAMQYTIIDSTVTKKIFNCDFNNGWCGMKFGKTDVDETASKYLAIESGRTSTVRTGPYFDHTFKNTTGRYLLFESSGVPKSSEAHIRTPALYIDKRTKGVYCVAFWVSMYGTDMGSIETHAKFMDGRGIFKSGKKLGVVEGEQSFNCGGGGCVKNDNWVQVKYEVPKWEDFLEIRIAFINGGEGYSDIGFDDLWIDEGRCPNNPDTKCSVPVRPKKKHKYSEVFTGNWHCFNNKNGNKFNTTNAALQMAQGSHCKMKCNNYKEMASPNKHAKIVCGRRGWHSQETGEAILNELPLIPGEMPNNAGKKDPKIFNLMPICTITRCLPIPMMPANAEFFACNHAETLDYLPHLSLCELRCKPGYRINGPQFTQCVAGGWMKGKHFCEKIPEEDMRPDEKLRLEGSSPQVIFTQPANPMSLRAEPVTLSQLTQPPAPTTKLTTTTKAITAAPVVTTQPTQASVVTTQPTEAPVVTTKPSLAPGITTTTKTVRTTTLTAQQQPKQQAVEPQAQATQAPQPTQAPAPTTKPSVVTTTTKEIPAAFPTPKKAEVPVDSFDILAEDELKPEPIETENAPVELKEPDFVVPTQESSTQMDHSGHEGHADKEKEKKAKKPEKTTAKANAAKLSSTFILIVFVFLIF